MGRVLKAADLFCGAGGTTFGAQLTGRVSVRLAVNHWQVAIASHSANHPEARHVCAPIEAVNPRDYAGTSWDILFASPECTHHANARGSRPMNDQRRAGGWDVVKWVEALRPSWVIIENVREWRDWGPLNGKGRPIEAKRGETFRAWVAAMESLGYRVEHRLLNAADYGEATSRVRLFVICRKGNRRITWPEPTHARDGGGPLFPLRRWRGAWEVIDWTRPCPSIFARKVPLKPKTLRRIEAGLRRFVGPHVVKLRRNLDAGCLGDPIGTITANGNHHGLAVPLTMATGSRGRAKPASEPCPTFTTAGGCQLIAPFLLPRQGFYDSRRDKPARGVDRPLPTIVGSHHSGHLVAPFLVQSGGPGHTLKAPDARSIDDPVPTLLGRNHHCVALPILVTTNHGDTRHVNGRTRSLAEPLPTITGHNGRGLAMPLLVPYSRTGVAKPVDEPLGTLTTHARFGAALPVIAGELIRPRGEVAELDPSHESAEAMASLIRTMRELGVADIGFRMLAIDELRRAQGFPEGYVLTGTKAEQTKQIGNAVCPQVARAIVEAITAA